MQEGKIIFRNCEDSEEVRLQLNPEAAAKELKEEMSELKKRAIKIIRNLLTLSMPIDYAKCPGPLQKIAEAEDFLKELEQ